MSTEINSEIVKKYGLDAGASVVGIAAAKDFDLAPKGFKPTDALKGCLSVIVFGSPSPQEALKTSVEYTNSRKAMVEKMNGIAKMLQSESRMTDTKHGLLMDLAVNG